MGVDGVGVCTEEGASVSVGVGEVSVGEVVVGVLPLVPGARSSGAVVVGSPSTP